MDTTQRRRFSAKLKTLGAYVSLSLTFVALAAWSWKKWIDPCIDSGQAPYIAWRLTQGEVLYRDLRYLYGPVTPYVTALLFRLFGTSLSTICYVNLTAIGLLTLVIYRFFKRHADPLVAVSNSLIFLAVFAFSQYLPVANFNYVYPYQQEAVQGMLVSVLSIAAATAVLPRGLQALRPFIVGIGDGILFCMKPEFFVSLTFALGLIVAVDILRGSSAEKRWLRQSLLFGVGFLLPLASFFLFFSAQVTSVEAFRSVLGGWLPVFDSNVSLSPFSREIAGLDKPWRNLWQTVAGAALSLTLWFCLLKTWAVLGRSRKQALASTALTLVGLVLPILLYGKVPLFMVYRGLPILTVSAVIYLFSLSRCSSDSEDRSAARALLCWGGFALALEARMLINVRIGHYGVFLGMPAALLINASMLWLLPRYLKSQLPLRLRLIPLGAVMGMTLVLLSLSNSYFREETYPMGMGSDRFYVYGLPQHPRGIEVAKLVEWIYQSTPAKATLVVLPEGVMVNYLTRRVSPLPYTNYMIGDLRAGQDAEILSLLEKHPPDLIALIHKDTREYGMGYFGQDRRYGKDIMDWISLNYRSEGVLGHEPLVSPAFGIKLLSKSGR